MCVYTYIYNNSLKNRKWGQDMVSHAYDPSIPEAEAGGMPQVQSHPGQHCDFQANLQYSVRFCVTNKQTNKQTKP